MSDGADDELASEWRELSARYAAVSGALEAELRQRHGLGLTEFEALDRLACAEQGKCRGTELNEAVHLSQSAASRLVARLERDGLVTRAMCEMDRRGIFVLLTETGWRRYREANPTYRAVLAATLREPAAAQ
ncbi:MarR family winged helix-turn-helix transcriptional regulator [Pseudonocardia nigra]|uniref:MarR family winged helix-turn-helix transcriptional regulator n=1 Tax=Pseudonocardia nigra TaxID=1921578 RepID=UPI0027E2B8FC|nr:MarR family transcriptional regulator [Pseudonocardia nigra]